MAFRIPLHLRNKSKEEIKQKTASANLHWNGAWRGIEELLNRGTVSPDDVTAVCLHLKGLGAILTDITGEQFLPPLPNRGLDLA